MSHHLVGVAEIVEMLGVSRQRVNAIANTHADFPAAEAELAGGRIWKRAAIEEWARRNGRAIQIVEVPESDSGPSTTS